MSILNSFLKIIKSKKKDENDFYILDDNYTHYNIQINNECQTNKILMDNEGKNDLKDNKVAEIRSKIVGLFCYSDNNIKLPVININDKVYKGQLIGFVKSLDNFNEIICEYDGIIQEVNIKNSEIVEYNKLLFLIKCL